MARRKIELVDIEYNGELKRAKICTKCNEVKILEEFTIHKKGKGGRGSYCKSCYKRWYEENKESVSERSKKNYDKDRSRENVYKYREDNPEKCREWFRKSGRKYYHTHKEKRLKAHELWRKKNPEMVKKNQLNWRATQKCLPAGLNMEVYNELKKSACFFTWSENAEVDHFIAVSTGHGGSYKGNLVPVIREINSSKCDKNPFEWFQMQSYISKKDFERLIAQLAKENCLTESEYKEFVYWCYENKRKKKEIEIDNRYSIEIWREYAQRPFPLPKYAIKGSDIDC